MTVVKEDGDPISLFDSRLQKEVAELVDPVIHLLIGEGSILKIESLFLRL
jgi:hypothetical protein